jgi:hypothetical protein
MASPAPLSSPVVNANMTNGTTSRNEQSKTMDSIIITPNVILPDKKSVNKDSIAIVRPPLNRLVQVYCILIENYLVPSTALELHLLLRLLAIPVATTTTTTTTTAPTNKTTAITRDASNQQNDNVVLRSILSSPAACIYFAKHALERLSEILRGLGLMQYLVTCPPFQQHCPDVTREFKTLLQQQEQQQHNKVTSTSARPSTILWKLQSTDKSATGSGPPPIMPEILDTIIVLVNIKSCTIIEKNVVIPFYFNFDPFYMYEEEAILRLSSMVGSRPMRLL